MINTVALLQFIVFIVVALYVFTYPWKIFHWIISLQLSINICSVDDYHYMQSKITSLKLLFVLATMCTVIVLCIFTSLYFLCHDTYKKVRMQQSKSGIRYLMMAEQLFFVFLGLSNGSLITPHVFPSLVTGLLPKFA